jgi:hypothetical protein
MDGAGLLDRGGPPARRPDPDSDPSSADLASARTPCARRDTTALQALFRLGIFAFSSSDGSVNSPQALPPRHEHIPYRIPVQGSSFRPDHGKSTLEPR